MKKVLALLLALVMSVTLFACGQKEETTPDGSDQGPVTIKVCTAQSGDGLVMLQEAAKAFSDASNGKYVVDLYNGGDYNEILLQVMTATQEDIPDIFASSGNNVSAILATADSDYQLFVPVQDFADAEGYDLGNILANLKTNYTIDEKWQCLPLGNTATGQYVNVTVLEDNGIKVEDLKSYQDILAALDTLAAAGLKNTYWIRHDYLDYLTFGLTAQGIAYFDNDNGRNGVPTKSLFADGGDCQRATTAYLQFVRDVIDRGYAYDPSLSASDARQAFANGEMVFMDGYASGAKSVISLMEDAGMPFTWAFRVSPVMEAGAVSKGQSPGGGTLFIANTGDEAREQGAWEFMKFLMEDEQVVNYSLTTGYLPYTASAAASAEYQKFVEESFPSANDIIAAQNATEYGVAYARIPFCSDFEAEFLNIINKMFEDSSYTAEQACADLAVAADSVVSMYRMENGLK